MQQPVTVTPAKTVNYTSKPFSPLTHRFRRPFQFRLFSNDLYLYTFSLAIIKKLQMIKKKMCALTIHLPLIGKDNLAPSAWWVNCERFLEALFDIGRPDAFCVRAASIIAVQLNGAASFEGAIFARIFVVAVGPFRIGVMVR